MIAPRMITIFWWARRFFFKIDSYLKVVVDTVFRNSLLCGGARMTLKQFWRKFFKLNVGHDDVGKDLIVWATYFLIWSSTYYLGNKMLLKATEIHWCLKPVLRSFDSDICDVDLKQKNGYMCIGVYIKPTNQLQYLHFIHPSQ